MNPTPLNSLTCPLDGANLIEAAAGTGKTYNIQNLTVRLILERNLPVESILVLTFTEAAAAELRRRIRSILQTTLSFLQQPEPGPEEGREAALIEAAAAAPEPTDRAECVRRLRRALLHFDEATITTIHGFCRRVLGDFAFESGVLFNSRLEKEYSKLLLELAQDFYRRNFYRKEHAALRALFAERSALTPEELMRPAARRIGQPQIRFRSRAAAPPRSTSKRRHDAWRRSNSTSAPNSSTGSKASSTNPTKGSGSTPPPPGSPDSPPAPGSTVNFWKT